MEKGKNEENKIENTIDLKPVNQLTEALNKLNETISKSSLSENFSKTSETLSIMAKEILNQYKLIQENTKATASLIDAKISEIEKSNKSMTSLLDNKIIENKKSLEEFSTKITEKIAEFTKKISEINTISENLSNQKKEIEELLKENKGKITEHIKKNEEELIKKEEEITKNLEERKQKLKDDYQKFMTELSNEVEKKKNEIEKIEKELFKKNEIIKKELYKIEQEKNDIKIEKSVLDEERKNLNRRIIEIETQRAANQAQFENAQNIDINRLLLDEKNNLESQNKILSYKLAKTEDRLIDLERELNEIRHNQDIGNLAQEQAHNLEEQIEYYREIYNQAINLLNMTSADIESKLEELSKLIGQYRNEKNSQSPYQILINIKNNFRNPNHNPQGRRLNNINELVNHFLGYSLNQGFIYGKEDICAFLCGFAQSKSRLTILQGISGTGKTSLPRLFMESIGMKDSCVIIPVQQNWRDRYELIGYYNEFQNRYNVLEFTKAVYKSTLDQTSPWVIILDEMNLSRVEYYFADFLSFFELGKENWKLKLWDGRLKGGEELFGQNSIEGDSILIKENLFFVGTVNEDESTYEISDKVYDRANVLTFNSRINNPENGINGITNPIITPYEDLKRIINNALNQNIDYNKAEQVRKEVIELYLEELGINVGYRFDEQIKNYYKIFYAAMLDTYKAADYFCSVKYLSKLKNLRISSDDNMKSNIIINLYNDLGNNFPRCRKELKRLFPDILNNNNRE